VSNSSQVKYLPDSKNEKSAIFIKWRFALHAFTQLKSINPRYSPQKHFTKSSQRQNASINRKTDHFPPILGTITHKNPCWQGYVLAHGNIQIPR